MNNSLNGLEQLKGMTKVVADTGDLNAIKLYQPVDATTNPSLILKAMEFSEYQAMISDAIAYGNREHNEKSDKDKIDAACTWLGVAIGKEIQSLVPGFVSTEVDARMSFDVDSTIKQAQLIIHLYKLLGGDPSRVLIKIAATWEGIQAAKQLEKQGIKCNLTLIFSQVQAQACAQAGVYLISPFVGRILDWYTQKENKNFSATEDPGVQSVKAIYHYFKKYGYQTIIMGASFRNVNEILELAGCDCLTISPQLLKTLQEYYSPIEKKLQLENYSIDEDQKPLAISERQFRWQLNQDAMATEKLAEGIRNFAADQEKLAQLVKANLID